MTVSPLDVLNPVFHFLDAAIQDYGLYLFIAFVYLIIPFTIWVLSGGLRRKLLRGKPMPHVPPVIMVYFLAGRPTPPPKPFEPFPPFYEPPECCRDDYPLD